MSAKKITLKDIAEEAGVSLTAASLYLNGKAKRYNLADGTCERIEKAIRAHNFTPNFHARAIASKKTFLVGVVIAQPLESSFWLNILCGLEEALADGGYHMLLSVSRGDPERERESIRFMRAKGVDGLIVNPLSVAPLKELSAAIPLITLNMPVEGLPGVWNDNFNGGRKAVEHLLANGHRSIAYIGGGVRRRRAYIDCMEKASLTPALFASVGEFLPRASEFTAVFCFSDYIMLGLYQEAAKVGIGIPAQLSVIGYDRMDFIRQLNPPPATISQFKNELGAAAGRLILELMENPDSSRREVVFEPELIPGSSVSLRRS